MAIQDWNIKGRSLQCAVTQRPFVEDELIHSALFFGDEGYERRDCSEEGWAQKPEVWTPISTWTAPFKPSPTVPVDPLKKDDIQGLLRVLIEENDSSTVNARYLLAVMLERKRQLRVLDRRENEHETVTVYEHIASGETWIIQDPKLRLDQLEPVQAEVTQLFKTRMA
ncbi:MAG: hypothetical protein V4507_15805 [Verrucomicrobiota bacterium]